MNRMVFIDTETSGLGPTNDRIIEIGLVVVENNRVVETWESLVNPETQIAPEIVAMTGINEWELETAPTFGQIYHEVQDRLKESVFVAHNARFDFSFMRAEFARLEQSFWCPQLCTVRLSRYFYPQERRHGLDSLIERFNLECQHRHRALGDALATYEFYTHLQKTFTKKNVAQAIEKLVKKPSFPDRLDSQELARVPESPGTYSFYNHEGQLLYVGKSVNIKERIQSHFYQDLTSHKELVLKEQVTEIKWQENGSNLTALLDEAQAIKEKQPLYNRFLRGRQEYWVVTLDTSNEIHSLNFVLKSQIKPQEVSSFAAIFKRKGKLRTTIEDLAAKNRLCRRYLNLEQTNRACFAYQLGECHGVCAGKEEPRLFNLRLEMALTPIKLKLWPYSGPIGVWDLVPSGTKNLYVFDQWCYLGKLKGDSSVSDLLCKSEAVFDLDIYQILKRFLVNSKELNIVELPIDRIETVES